jgi:DNA-binding NtrC family response regulator
LKAARTGYIPAMPRLLVVDDQQETLDLLARLFLAEGYSVDVAAEAPLAVELLDANEYDVVFTDLRLGYEHDGMEILQEAKARQPHTQVLIMTAFSSVESSLQAMQAGAYDYITKPFNREELVLLAHRAAEKAQLARRVERLEAAVKGEGPSGTQIIGKSKAILRVMRLVGQVARTGATVLVTGESGTGKELIAKAIHQLSPRVDAPFVAVNCGAIPENLQESEFFGHVKGAFTGASRTKTGLFEQADHGTLFLDEVGETSLATQVKLLRFLQSGEVRKVGDTRPAIVDARLVAATNRDLLSMIAAKHFREDLYYRLNIVAVEVPPLRERDGDIELLAGFFLGRYARKTGNDVRGFSDAAMERLLTHNWPGNVRELENAVERAVTLSPGPLVDVDDLPRLDRPPPPEARPMVSGSFAPLGSGDWEQARREGYPDPYGAPGHPGVPNPYGGGYAGPAWAAYADPGVVGNRYQAPPVPDPAGVSGRFPAPVPAARALPPRPLSSDRVPSVGFADPNQGFPSLKEVERLHIIRALELFDSNRTKASSALGISKATLWRKIKLYEIDL